MSTEYCCSQRISGAVRILFLLSFTLALAASEVAGQAPCEEGPFPACSGSCPAGLLCVSDAVDQVCRCDQPPCDQSLFPQCAGPCPAGSVCLPDSESNTCLCVQPSDCDQGSFPECAGSCPPGLICVSDASSCQCAAACEEGPFPACSGSCPAGLTCVSDADVCDCQSCTNAPPGEIHGVFWASKQQMGWAEQFCATVYNVYRETAPALADADDNGVADDYGPCFQGNLPTNEMFDTDNPPANQTQFYLVTGENSTGEGTMGFASNLLERPNLTPCQ